MRTKKREEKKDNRLTTKVSLKEAKIWATPNTFSPSLTFGLRSMTFSSLTFTAPFFPPFAAGASACFSSLCDTLNRVLRRLGEMVGKEEKEEGKTKALP